MKKIIFLIIAIIYSSSVNAQQVQLNDGVSVVFPSNIQQITKNQALDHVNKRLGNSKTVFYSVNAGSSKRKRFYKIGDVLMYINLFDTTYNLPSDHFLNLKKGLDEVNSSGTASST